MQSGTKINATSETDQASVWQQIEVQLSFLCCMALGQKLEDCRDCRPVGRVFYGRVRSKEDMDRTSAGRASLYWGLGACFPAKFWKLSCLRMYVLHFEGSVIWKPAAKSELKTWILLKLLNFKIDFFGTKATVRIYFTVLENEQK